jgi:hypothetical protein
MKQSIYLPCTLFPPIYMQKKSLVYYSALLLLAAGCAKEEIAPTPQAVGSMPADMLAVLKKHNATYVSDPVLGSAQPSKPAFRNARELDSMLTKFEHDMRLAKLVEVTPDSKGKGGAKDAITNAMLQGIGTKQFDVQLPDDLKSGAVDPNAHVLAIVTYRYCTGDGLFRSASTQSVLNGTTLLQNSTLTYSVLASVTNVYTDQIHFNFVGSYVYELRGNNYTIRTPFTQNFSGAIGNDTNEFVRNNDQCSEPLPPAYTGGGNGNNGGGGSGDNPAPPTPTGPVPGGGYGGNPTYPAPGPSGDGNPLPKPPPPTQPIENV